MPSALYSRDILRLASAIPHLGRLERPQASAEKSSPVCGSRVAVDVALDGEGRVAALGQEVKACALGQASSSIMARHVVGSTAEELRLIREAMRRNGTLWDYAPHFDANRDALQQYLPVRGK